ncbi:MAG: nitrogen fixation protein NifX [Okeania sp. SIO2G4]|uniref:nitrogen fixation protein NifX n=1 Tax=unclassified Okeania TaxID=2634635 RepID=UPI0013B8EB47|nr:MULTISPECIES: nitrogen fixation protein NifX [unclassified Okeania]NEP04025.1 nitrogen fixation protein NifX [Okeania sp. SIO4D6]NEP45535.1 nitrogen fixation protein NifX [Okeania sp. SIO2H7]NEP70823.1 nitrogen fixation protein NifX [Okeania sp. SIO2G5]NEP92398.1 nitrogen fixation protein NifX [Okeania sp. SIO2F5]NEQ89874.1 nitrogen fixation protein NifX [Okeania sp. SIO2G4]
MKVAFATTDFIHIDGHFGSAKQMALYEVDDKGYEVLAPMFFGGNLSQEAPKQEKLDKLHAKVAALLDCTIVYVLEIGGPAAGRLINKKVTPMKSTSEEQTIIEVLDRLVETLKGNPPPWLRKALRKDSVADLEALLDI